MAMQGFGYPTPPGIPSYPGPASINGNPFFQYNPTFDGQFAHGLTSNPYDNSLFEDLNTMQGLIYGQNNPPLGFPMLPGAPLQGTPVPIGPFGPTSTTGAEGATGGGATGGGAGSAGHSMMNHQA